MIINNIAKTMDTKRSKVFERRQQYNNRYHKTNTLAVCPIDGDNRPYSAVGLCNNSQWTYYALFHSSLIFASCFGYPSNKACKVFNFLQLPINSTAKF